MKAQYKNQYKDAILTFMGQNKLVRWTSREIASGIGIVSHNPSYHVHPDLSDLVEQNKLRKHISPHNRKVTYSLCDH